MAKIDYLKLRNCPSCDVSWVEREWGDGTFHTNLVAETEDDYKGAMNCYRCPNCRAVFPREVYVPPASTQQHTYTPFMNP